MGAKQDLKNVADFKYISVICVFGFGLPKKINQNKLIYFCLDFSERNVPRKYIPNLIETFHFLQPCLPIVQLEVVLLNCEI